VGLTGYPSATIGKQSLGIQPDNFQATEPLSNRVIVRNCFLEFEEPSESLSSCRSKSCPDKYPASNTEEEALINMHLNNDNLNDFYRWYPASQPLEFNKHGEDERPIREEGAGDDRLKECCKELSRPHSVEASTSQSIATLGILQPVCVMPIYIPAYLGLAPQIFFKDFGKHGHAMPQCGSISLGSDIDDDNSSDHTSVNSTFVEVATAKIEQPKCSPSCPPSFARENDCPTPRYQVSASGSGSAHPANYVHEVDCRTPRCQVPGNEEHAVTTPNTGSDSEPKPEIVCSPTTSCSSEFRSSADSAHIGQAYGLISSVVSRQWPLDGEDELPRQPATWEEVDQAVKLEVQTRAGSSAPLASQLQLLSSSFPKIAAQQHLLNGSSPTLEGLQVVGDASMSKHNDDGSCVVDGRNNAQPSFSQASERDDVLKPKSSFVLGCTTVMVADIGLSVERDEFITWLEKQACALHERLSCDPLQSLQTIQAWYSPSYMYLGEHANHNSFFLEIPNQLGMLLLTPPSMWIDFVNLRFEAPDKSTVSLVNRGHAFVNCINALAAALLTTEEFGIKGKSICPPASRSFKKRAGYQVAQAGCQGLEKNVQYLKEDAQGKQSQSGLPEQCRAMYKVNGQWQIVCPEQNDEQPLIDRMTTVMMRGIPPRFCTASVKEMVDKTGYEGKYDYIYLPPNQDLQKTGNSMGYGFVNFLKAADARNFMQDWPNTVLSKNSNKTPSANWATRRQGFDANLRFHESQSYDQVDIRGALPDSSVLPQFFVNGHWHVMQRGRLVSLRHT